MISTDNPTETEAQQLAAAKEKLGITALERAVTNLIQELQARNGQLATSSSPGSGGIRGTIEGIINLAATALSKYQPAPQGEAILAKRLVDSALMMQDAVTQIVLKNAGIGLPAPIQHMTVAH